MARGTGHLEVAAVQMAAALEVNSGRESRWREVSDANVDDIDIEDFAAERRKQVAPAKVNRDLNILSHTFNLARAKLGCTGLWNPFGKGTCLKLPRDRIRRLSIEEEALLRQAVIYEVSGKVRIGSNV